MPSYVRGRGSRQLSDIEIIRAYVSGENSEDIALRAGCSGATVLDIVRKAGETIRKPGKRGRRPLRLPEEEIVRRYRAGESGTSLADAAHCASRTIYDILRANGCQPRPRTSLPARDRFKPPGAKDHRDG